MPTSPAAGQTGAPAGAASACRPAGAARPHPPARTVLVGSKPVAHRVASACTESRIGRQNKKPFDSAWNARPTDSGATPDSCSFAPQTLRQPPRTPVCAGFSPGSTMSGSGGMAVLFIGRQICQARPGTCPSLLGAGRGFRRTQISRASKSIPSACRAP